MKNKYFSLNTGQNSHPFDLRALAGERRTGRPLSTFSLYGESTYYTRYRTTTQREYDMEFIRRINTISPVALASDFIDYHASIFSEIHGSSNEFLDHIKYTILPLIKLDASIHIVKNWVDRRERQVLIYYLDSQSFIDVKEGRKSREALLYYKYIFAEYQGAHDDLDRFRVKIAFQRGLKREYLRYGNTSEVIWKEFHEKRSGFFTFDGYNFYEIEQMSQFQNGDAELILKKMEEKKPLSPPPHITVTGSNNIVNLGSIENSILSIKQQLSQLGDQEVAEALRQFADAISQSESLSNDQKEEALQSIEFLAEQATPGLAPKKGLIKRSIETLQAVLPSLGQLASFTGQNLTKLLPVIIDYFKNMHNISF